MGISECKKFGANLLLCSMEYLWPQAPMVFRLFILGQIHPLYLVVPLAWITEPTTEPRSKKAYVKLLQLHCVRNNHHFQADVWKSLVKRSFFRNKCLSKLWLLIENLQTFSYHHETWLKWLDLWLFILTKFHDDISKILDFLLTVKFWTNLVFHQSVSSIDIFKVAPVRPAF